MCTAGSDMKLINKKRKKGKGNERKLRKWKYEFILNMNIKKEAYKER